MSRSPDRKSPPPMMSGRDDNTRNNNNTNANYVSSNNKEGGDTRRYNRPESRPSTTVAIFGLNPDTTEGQLEKICQEFGKVTSAKLILDHDTQKSRGFAFVTFEDQEAATQAKEKLQDRIVDGGTWRTDYSNKKERGSRTGGGGYSSKRDYDDGGGGRYQRHYQERADPYERRPMTTNTTTTSRPSGYDDKDVGNRRSFSRSPPRRSYSSRSPPPKRRYSRSPPRRDRY